MLIGVASAGKADENPFNLNKCEYKLPNGTYIDFEGIMEEILNRLDALEAVNEVKNED